MQAPGSILLHLDSSARTAQRIQLARQLAEDFSAQVTGQPCLLTALVRYPFAMEGAGAAVAATQEQDKEAIDKIHKLFHQLAAGHGRLHWTDPLADGPWGFARQALYADLVILGQRDAKDPAAAELPSDFVSSVLLDSGRPGLILPFSGEIGVVGRTVLVAWKETRTSARAVSASLPWLQRAGQVHAVGFGEDVDATLQPLQDYLQTHCVHTKTHAGGPEDSEVGERLLSMAADVDADLLVMGCYGHGRTREWVLGGATRTVLASMTLPVLMAH
ncbi:universal stress protein [Hydrogenophaga sp. PBL-H3]|uniref:universal stress protein n=1 Tax=Hydrogenophaga sp. PBL-H3 TaxID=434010 RepID=UPI00131FB76E|nr:universal stress protein [Hydrogenophaga sp. PBL-H3]QHE75033.1 universal stress protein [Hydrogenophaga sp. PBL-H3]QHE79460.1 universal stress protein [Hydrogenophaga sp. PBL-H3]